MQNKSIKFTPSEQEVIQNDEFLLVKQQAIDKVLSVFSALKEEIEVLLEQNQWWDQIPGTIGDVKMAKGESYRSLPYVILDYPRKFSFEDIFAYRCMFWWGHFFSFTLHLQGQSRKKFAPLLKEGIHQTDPSGLYLAVGDTPFEYHYGADNYKPLEDFTHSEIETLFENKDFIKLSSKLPITSDSEQVVEAGKHFFQKYMKLMFSPQ